MGAWDRSSSKVGPCGRRHCKFGTCGKRKSKVGTCGEEIVNWSLWLKKYSNETLL